MVVRMSLVDALCTSDFGLPTRIPNLLHAGILIFYKKNKVCKHHEKIIIIYFHFYMQFFIMQIDADLEIILYDQMLTVFIVVEYLYISVY